ncbi:hypothetical protein LAZ67_15003291 [Cordylochernes scorpioides]|uniref:Uncharacterized protein n=1 Tax=Cordylochernes scorpioides TaxID=51811 RepID=A0ABY6LAF9_9ARAC|nr:hypothetical protein LAZ67_15003291 [Cordylochernes scorpioides]
MALGRLHHTERKLAKDLLLLAAYKAKFDEYLEKGYIRNLDSIEVTKGTTPIQKLELQGCVLGTRFAVLLRSELRLPKVDREVFWSDSKTVLALICSEAGHYIEFVANRVGEIQEATKGTN